MQLPETPKYKSSAGVDARKTVYIDSKDPRAQANNPNNPMGRSGAYLDVKNLVGNSFLVGTAADNAVLNGVVNPSDATPGTFTPGANNYPPTQYPGGSGPTVLVITDPTAPVATWLRGDILSISFTWDSTLGTNAAASQFGVQLTDQSGEVKTYGGFPINTSSTSQTIIITPSINEQMFNVFDPNLTGVAVEVLDPLNNRSNLIIGSFANVYIFDLPAPILGSTLNITSVNNGYSVSFTSPTGTSSSLADIDVWEIESTATTAPAIVYGADGQTPTNYNRVYLGNLNPYNVISPNTNQRYVVARFGSNGGRFTAFSAAAQITPTSPVTINITPPTEVTTVTAAWDTVSTNDIDITCVMPSANAGASFIAKLVAPNGAAGYFYLYPSGTSSTQVFQITDGEMFAQFGQYFPSFTGTFVSVSGTGVKSAGIAFTVPNRSNLLASLTPNPTVTPIIDGYVVAVSNETSDVSYAEVYEYYLDPTAMEVAMSDLMDYMISTYVSGGASGSTSIVTSNWISEDGAIMDPTSCYGMAIHGTGIAPSTYVTSITATSTSGQYTINLSAPLTAQASGTYNALAMVESGSSPLTIYDVDYQQKYVVVTYYDKYGNNSLFGPVRTVTPTSPTTSLITSAVEIAKTADPAHPAAIYMSSTNSPTSGSRILMGTSNSEAGIFVWGPNDTNPSTQILGDNSSSLTFITKNAQIGDWSVTPDHIQNDLSTGSFNGGYTGLSGSNPNYAFWAGADASDNSDGSAKFSVSPSGVVHAGNLNVSGGALNISNNFIVDTAGDLTANGTIAIGGSGSIGGNLSLAGSLYSGTLNSTKSDLASGIPGYILNSSGLKFNSASTAGITTIDATTGTLITKAANIGGWNVNSYQITRAGTGNITLDSSAGTISVSSTNVAGNTAGIHAPTLPSDNVFWAGSSSANSTSNQFRVTLAGNLYSSGATITNGTVSTAGIAGTVMMDGNNDWLSLNTSGVTSYLVPRNGNVYLIAPSTSQPTFGTDPDAPPTSVPYFSAGSSFKDYWGNKTTGVGIYTGIWDYFTQQKSNPFVTVTKTGIQLSASPAIGMIVDGGDPTLTGTKITNAANANVSQGPAMLLYTANSTKGTPTDFSPSTIYGAWARMTSGNIHFSTGGTTSTNNTANNIDIDYTNGITISASTLTENIAVNSNGVTISAGGGIAKILASSSGIQMYTNVTNPKTYMVDGVTYTDPINQVITFGSTGIVYTAPRFSGDLLDTLAAAGASSGGTASNVNNDNFVRMVMRDPQAAGTKYDGVNSTIEMTSGPAIYYSKGTNPVSAGYVGDIWLTF